MTTPWIAAFSALAVFALLVGLVVLGVMRQVMPLIDQAESALTQALGRLRLYGLPEGAAAPGFTAETAMGDVFTERDLYGRESVVIFVTSSCAACARLLQDLETAEGRRADIRLVAIVDQNDLDALRAAQAGGATVLVQRRGSMSRLFESDRTPHAYVLDEHAVIRASGTPDTWRAIEELVAATRKGGEEELDLEASLSVMQQ